MNRATLDKDPHEVASMFDAVARRYDLTNTVLSLGQDRHWRRATRSALQIGPGDRVLDLAAGTAVSTVELGRSGAGSIPCSLRVLAIVVRATSWPSCFRAPRILR